MLFRPVRFCVNYILFTALVSAISFGLLVFLDVDGSGATSVIPLLMAGMMEGQNFVKRAQGQPRKSAMWGAAFKMGWLAFLLSMVTAAMFFAVFPELLAPMAALHPVFWVAVTLFVYLFLVVMLRLGYGLGVRTGMKTLAPAR